jgi:hypothetical protein
MRTLAKLLPLVYKMCVQTKCVVRWPTFVSVWRSFIGRQIFCTMGSVEGKRGHVFNILNPREKLCRGDQNFTIWKPVV